MQELIKAAGFMTSKRAEKQVMAALQGADNIQDMDVIIAEIPGQPPSCGVVINQEEEGIWCASSPLTELIPFTTLSS